MTVCIAAACRQNNEPRIVICADTRLESFGVGASDGTLKMHPIFYGWVALLATDDWNSASMLLAYLQRHWRRLRPLATIRRIPELTKQIGIDFEASSFCMAQTEALLMWIRS